MGTIETPTTTRSRAALSLLAALGLVLFTLACSTPAPAPATAVAPAVKSPEARAKWYQDCWALFNEKAWEKFQECYTVDATAETVDSTEPVARGRAAIIERDKAYVTAFPDRRGEVRLVLAHGPHVVSVALWTGTHEGPMPGPDGKPIPPTKKKIGLLFAHRVELDATGSQAVRDAAYLEEGTFLAQLGLMKAPARPVMAPTGAAATVVVAKNDDLEAKNVAAMQTMFDAGNKHDLKALEALMTDDYKLIEVARPKDLDKKAAMAGTKEMFSAFADVKMTPTTLWGAGDYVVIEGTFEGTNTGDLPSMGVKKTGKKVSSRFLEICKFENGKVKEDWLFYNGAAFAAQLGLK